ncbi:MAG: YIP1 family protein [Nitrospiraceae bacterium]|nr:YIP1 family protein [Nitrospiraceae bacterium]
METKGVNLGAVPQTAMKVLTSPAAFFREMPKTGGFIDPLVFAVALGVVGGVVHAVVQAIKFHFVAGIAGFIGSIVIFPIVIAIASFIGAAILFFIWQFMGSKESYETAYRCCAYLMALSPLQAALTLIPFIGMAIFLVIQLYYIVMASVEVHSIPSEKAWRVFGIIAAVLILLNVSAEFAARRAVNRFGEASKEMQKAAEDMQKQAEQMQQQMQQKADEGKKAAEEARKQLEEMQKQNGKQ